MKINNLSAGSGAECGYTERCAVDCLHPYDGFNACHYTNDTPHHVYACRQHLAGRLGVTQTALVIPHQTHSTNVAVIDTPPTVPLVDTDALVTGRSGIVLCINTADCVPLLLNDPDAGIIATCHAGWRGTVNGIVERTIQAMISAGASAKHIHAAIGPCICAECFEVGQEVAEHFTRWENAVLSSPEWSKPHVNLPAAVTHILIEQGLLNAHISQPPACTRCSWRRLFSARKFGINSGRMLSFIMRK